MKKELMQLGNSILKKFDMEIVRYSHLQRLENYEREIDSLLDQPESKLFQLMPLLEKSQAQLKQDLFVLTELGFKKNGYFVEFGATNGVKLSNTHLLEKEFGWNGILAEPARCWHDELKANRNCHIETNCVWIESGSVLTFNEVNEAELSTINSFNNSDNHSKGRTSGNTYEVNTISLNDLLEKYDAPKNIDYLSIDTEGSEFDILNSFDFSKYNIGIITCEHNYTPMREKIFDLLSGHGYKRKYTSLSKWDDWYIKAS